jgi:hypothetical protein
MREVLSGDVTVAARALLPCPAAARRPLMRRMIAEADLADRYRKRIGRGHRLYGNGSLMAAALARDPPPEPYLSDAEYLDCLATVIAALADRRNGVPVFSSCRPFRMKEAAYLV